MQEENQVTGQNADEAPPLEGRSQKVKGSEKTYLLLALGAFVSGVGALVAVVLGAIFGAVYGGLNGSGNGNPVEGTLVGIFVGTGLVLDALHAIAFPQIAGVLEVFSLVVLGFIVWQVIKGTIPRPLSKTMVSSIVLASVGVFVGAEFLANGGLL